MVALPRRLKKLDFEQVEQSNPIQGSNENLAESEKDLLQGPHDIDGLLASLPQHHP